MAISGLDEAWAKADPAAAYAAGYRFVVGYVSQDTTGKNLSSTDVAALHSAGLDVGLVYEFATSAALGGAVRGRSDAWVAVDHAKTLGAPAGTCLYFAIDFNVTASQLDTALAYLQGAESVVRAAGYRIGVYGGYSLCAYLVGRWSGLLWQTYAWSAGQWCPAAVLRQVRNGVHVAGADVDVDEAEALDWGQWRGADMAFDPAAWGQVKFPDGVARSPETTLAEVWEFLAHGQYLTKNRAATGQLYADARAAATSLAGGLVLTDAQVAAIAAAITAHPDNPLGPDDEPAIVAAVKEALREGTA